ncbi:MAG: FecR domain-containing protein [Marinilabiliales bacterium]|nr:FecR domain-containing protein [Marinilabiliales bacterium]
MENLSKYIENKNFILWVFQPNAELELWWTRFETDHPEEKRNLVMARKVLRQFRTTNQSLTEAEKIDLFSGILKQVEEKEKSRKLWHLTHAMLKYAAVALLFFAIGATLFYKKDRFNPQFFGQDVSEPNLSGNAKLIRANGEDILLKQEKSVLKYQADGKLVVNNDTLAPDLTKKVSRLAMNQLIIPYGKTSVITLPDGTRVHLNAGSKLTYPDQFDGQSREVYLLGEAFFDVTHDSQHPFVVQTNDFRVKVLGTRFNLSAYPTDSVFETVLAEGKVSLELNSAGLFDRSVVLEPDQMASFYRSTKETTLSKVDADNYILWTDGLLKFESTDLSRITKKLERFYNVTFHYKDPLLGGLRITGKLELKEDLNEVFVRIAKAANVTIARKGETQYEISN